MWAEEIMKRKGFFDLRFPNFASFYFLLIPYSIFHNKLVWFKYKWNNLKKSTTHTNTLIKHRKIQKLGPIWKRK